MKKQRRRPHVLFTRLGNVMEKMSCVLDYLCRAATTIKRQGINMSVEMLVQD